VHETMFLPAHAVSQFIASDLWSPDNPDLNPVDWKCNSCYITILLKFTSQNLLQSVPVVIDCTAITSVIAK